VVLLKLLNLISVKIIDNTRSKLTNPPQVQDFVTGS
jgi:hypothetical protein